MQNPHIDYGGCFKNFILEGNAEPVQPGLTIYGTRYTISDTPKVSSDPKL